MSVVGVEGISERQHFSLRVNHLLIVSLTPLDHVWFWILTVLVSVLKYDLVDLHLDLRLLFKLFFDFKVYLELVFDFKVDPLQVLTALHEDRMILLQLHKVQAEVILVFSVKTALDDATLIWIKHWKEDFNRLFLLLLLNFCDVAILLTDHLLFLIDLLDDRFNEELAGFQQFEL